MNTYRVTLTAIMADSRDYDVEASTEADAWEAAEDRMNADLPDLQEIRRDDLELLTAAPVEPPTDPLAQARDIIARLLDAAEHGAMDLSQTDEPAGAKASGAIEAARAFLATKEPTP